MAKWRIYNRPIAANLQTIEDIVLGTVCLHNFLKKSEERLPNHQRNYCPTSYIDYEDDDGNILPGEWRRDGAALPSVSIAGSNTNSQNAANLRAHFKNYFLNEGAVPLQWDRII